MERTGAHPSRQASHRTQKAKPKCCLTPSSPAPAPCACTRAHQSTSESCIAGGAACTGSSQARRRQKLHRVCGERHKLYLAAMGFGVHAKSSLLLYVAASHAKRRQAFDRSSVCICSVHMCTCLHLCACVCFHVHVCACICACMRMRVHKVSYHVSHVLCDSLQLSPAGQVPPFLTMGQGSGE